MEGERIIDHIVYAVPDLDKAIDSFEQLSGVRPIFGGYHTIQGTKNALVNLGGGTYLELLAIDDSNEIIRKNRWMGIDLISEPKVTRWALKTEAIQKDSKVLQSYNPNMGQTQGGQRKLTNGKMLKWELTMPLSSPEVEIIPFITDWQVSDVHPTDSLPELCRLVDIDLSHPNANLMQEVLDDLGCQHMIRNGKNARISISINCPKGVIEI